MPPSSQWIVLGASVPRIAPPVHVLPSHVNSTHVPPIPSMLVPVIFSTVGEPPLQPGASVVVVVVVVVVVGPAVVEVVHPTGGDVAPEMQSVVATCWIRSGQYEGKLHPQPAEHRPPIEVHTKSPVSAS